MENSTGHGHYRAEPQAAVEVEVDPQHAHGESGDCSLRFASLELQTWKIQENFTRACKTNNRAGRYENAEMRRLMFFS